MSSGTRRKDWWCYWPGRRNAQQNFLQQRFLAVSVPCFISPAFLHCVAFLYLFSTVLHLVTFSPVLCCISPALHFVQFFCIRLMVPSVSVWCIGKSEISILHLLSATCSRRCTIWVGRRGWRLFLVVVHCNCALVVVICFSCSVLLH